MQVYDFCKYIDENSFTPCIDFRIILSIEEIQDFKSYGMDIDKFLGNKLREILEEKSYLLKNGYRMENGKHCYYRDGVLHNLYGPAVIHMDYKFGPYEEYILYGTVVFKEIYDKLTKNIPLFLWYKKNGVTIQEILHSDKYKNIFV